MIEEVETVEYMIPDKVYAVLKWAGLIALPAVATFIGTVGTAAGWDGTNMAVTVVTACGTLIGALIGISCATAKPADPSADDE